MQRPLSSQIAHVVSQFQDRGITAIFNLTEPGEHPYCGDALNAETGMTYAPEAFMNAGIRYFNWSWPDMQVPSIAMLSDIVQVANHEINAGGRIAVHCHAGLGRTGVVAAAVLLQSFLTSDQAIQIVRSRRRGTVQNQKQVTIVKEFEQHLTRLRNVFPLGSTGTQGTPVDCAASAYNIEFDVPAKTFLQTGRDQLALLSHDDMMLLHHGSSQVDAASATTPISSPLKVAPRAWALKYVSKLVILICNALKNYDEKEEIHSAFCSGILDSDEEVQLMQFKHSCNNFDHVELTAVCTAGGDAFRSQLKVLAQLLLDWLDSRSDEVMSEFKLNYVLKTCGDYIQSGDSSVEAGVRVSKCLSDCLDKAKLYVIQILLELYESMLDKENDCMSAVSNADKVLVRVAVSLTRANDFVTNRCISSTALSAVLASAAEQQSENIWVQTPANAVKLLQYLAKVGWRVGKY
eukprot:GSChrysophyteH1.ASY1.ANO1.2238.1 assembled CDS